jgi:hypothetical protein
MSETTMFEVRQRAEALRDLASKLGHEIRQLDAVLEPERSAPLSVTVNVNWYAYVRLTQAGRAHWRKCLVDLGVPSKYWPSFEPDADGRNRFQMWELMQIFGPLMYMGNTSPPFDGRIDVMEWK